MQIGSSIEQIKEWYEHHEKPISAASLVFGFIFDSLTIQQITSIQENLWISFNLLLASVCIIVLNKSEDSESHFWFINILQFSFGALLGSFFIFYFRSASLVASWPFLLILLAALISNEVLKKRYVQLVFQISFLYFSIFAFAIFRVPIFLHSIGPHVFILSGVVSLACLGVYLSILKRFVRERFLQSREALLKSIASLFFIINILYFAHIIPPIPLVLKDASVAYSLRRLDNSSYQLSVEERHWWDFFQSEEKVHLQAAESLYIYTAIYSPAQFSTKIYHVWQYLDKVGDWVTASKIPLALRGGRDDGFRTFSFKNDLAPGSWRVNVVTENGQYLGRINFKVEEGLRPRVTLVKN